MKYCNPDTCSECLYIGEGDSICEISHELVLDNWQSVPHTTTATLLARRLRIGIRIMLRHKDNRSACTICGQL